MKVRATLLMLGTAAIVAASGCCNPYVYRGCNAPCGPAGCGPCEEVVTCRLPAPCVDTCGPETACNDCESSCGGYGYGCGWYPGKQVVEWLTCGAGCGGVYVNEWCNDPPDCCDPCSPCGGYSGGACCVPLHTKIWAAILGEPCCEPYLPTLDFVGGCGPEPCCGSAGCGGDCGGDMPVMTGKGGVHMTPEPMIVPGSPADGKGKTEAIPVPELAPTRATTAKTAHQYPKRRTYYPQGRVHSR